MTDLTVNSKYLKLFNAGVTKLNMFWR